MNGNNALRADTDSARRNTINPLLILLEDQAVRIDALEGRVHDLEQALQIDGAANVQSAFGVTEILAQLLIMLADGKPRNKERLHAGLYYLRSEHEEPEVKIMDTHVCKLRKHLEPFGVEITTVWGTGYRITAGLEVVRAAIEHAAPYGEAEAARLRRLERDRLRQRLIRTAQGRVDRAHSITSQKPWEAAGVSRATWYRRRETILSQANDDKIVSRQIIDSRVAA